MCYHTDVTIISDWSTQPQPAGHPSWTWLVLASWTWRRLLVPSHRSHSCDPLSTKAWPHKPNALEIAFPVTYQSNPLCRLKINISLYLLVLLLIISSPFICILPHYMFFSDLILLEMSNITVLKACCRT